MEPELTVMKEAELLQKIRDHQVFLRSFPHQRVVGWQRFLLSEDNPFEFQVLKGKFKDDDKLAQLNHCVIEKINLQRERLIASNWSSSRISGCSFEACLFDQSISVKSSWENILFDRCRLNHLDFSDSAFNKVTFDHCQMHHADFERGKITAGEWLACNLASASFKDAKIENVKISNCIFTHCNLSGAEFTGCIFDGCSFADLNPDSLIFDTCKFAGCDGLPESGEMMKDCVFTP